MIKSKEIKAIVVAVNIYREGKNAIYGEDVTTLSLDDESVGGFFDIRQEQGQISLNLEEIEIIHIQAKAMLKDYEP